MVSAWSVQTSIHMQGRNEVTLVLGSLRLAPISEPYVWHGQEKAAHL